MYRFMIIAVFLGGHQLRERTGCLERLASFEGVADTDSDDRVLVFTTTFGPEEIL